MRIYIFFGGKVRVVGVVCELLIRRSQIIEYFHYDKLGYFHCIPVGAGHV